MKINHFNHNLAVKSLLIALFFCVGFWIIIFANVTYSDALHFLMGYTNLWLEGNIPYWKHLFEYPYFSIPFIFLPKVAELLSIGSYYINFRIFELLLAFWIFTLLLALYSKKIISLFNLLIFLAGMFVAQYYIFEGIDMAFTAAYTTAFVLPKISLLSEKKESFVFWFFLLISTAIKFMTAPLVPLFFVIRVFAKTKDFKLKKIIGSRSFKNEISQAFIAGLIIWVIPGMILRKKILIPIIFHTTRPLHWSSFPAFIVQTIDSFTHTETQLHYEYTGPITSVVLTLSNYAMIAGLAFLAVWLFFKIIIRKKKYDWYMLCLKTFLIYLWIFLLTGKLFSPPFNLWFLAVAVIFPFKNKIRRTVFFALLIFIMALNMTNWVELGWGPFIGPFNMGFAKGLLRFVPIFIVLIMSFFLPERHNENK